MRSEYYNIELAIELDEHGNKNLFFRGCERPICQHDYLGNHTLGRGMEILFNTLYIKQSIDKDEIKVNSDDKWQSFLAKNNI
jgi:hypothetical protein